MPFIQQYTGLDTLSNVLLVHTALCETNSRMYDDFKWTHLHTATIAPLSDLYSSQSSYCFSRWADTWNTVCSLEKHAHCQYSQHVRACHAFLVLMRNVQLQNPDQSCLLRWVGTNLNWTQIKWIQSSWMSFRCPGELASSPVYTESGFKLVQ